MAENPPGGILPPTGIDLVNYYIDEIYRNLAKVPNITQVLNDAGNITGEFKDNQTMVTAQVAAFSDVAVGYGHGFFDGGLKVGANVKMIRGDVSSAAYRIFNDEKEVSDVIDDAWDDKKTSYKPALDIGINADINELFKTGIPMSPKVGLVAKNINGPRFSTTTDSDYKLDPQIRMGVALQPSKFWLIAADLDLTENNTLLKNYDSRQFALGTEINLVNKKRFNLPLRAGIMKNLASSDDELMFTAGLGFMMAVLNIELAGAMSTGSETVDGTKVPKQAAAALSVSLHF